MLTIGLLSDTHGDLPPTIFNFFKDCEEIWHAGDIGNPDVVSKLEGKKTFRAVFGNIDGQDIRSMFPEYLIFNVEELKVLIIHQGGYPGHYRKGLQGMIRQHQPGLVITGHSHILKVMHDKRNDCLFINPGAAGNKGWHKVITYLRFNIEGKSIRDLEVGELDRGYIQKNSLANEGGLPT